MGISVKKVGHVVLKVRDLERADAFYRNVIGLEEVARGQSIYLNDPDGDGLELYVDADPAIWRGDPASVAHAQPLSL